MAWAERGTAAIGEIEGWEGDRDNVAFYTGSLWVWYQLSCVK